MQSNEIYAQRAHDCDRRIIQIGKSLAGMARLSICSKLSYPSIQLCPAGDMVSDKPDGQNDSPSYLEYVCVYACMYVCGGLIVAISDFMRELLKQAACLISYLQRIN